MPNSEHISELLGRVQLPPGWTEVNIAVALSGGADSMALLRALHERKQLAGGPGNVLAFHVNHQLRGEESDQDARWCQQQGEALGIQLQVLPVATQEFADKTKQGLEAAARQQRYEVLTRAAQQAGVRYLATAHTRDDQVETVLFRILRGTGLRGLAGIPQVRALTESLTVIRPLISCTRSMITAYLDDLGQTYRTDYSNLDQVFTRNRLRHGVLPQLRAHFNQELDEALVRLATQAADGQKVIERLATDYLSSAVVSVDSQRLSLRWGAFAGADKIVVCEALRTVWRQAELAEQAMTYDWWCQLAELVLGHDNAQILNLPGDVHASIEGEDLVLRW